MNSPEADIGDTAQTVHGACLVSELLRCAGSPHGLPTS